MYPIIYLEWIDAFSRNVWTNKEDIDTTICSVDWTIQEVGYLIKETKEYILLASMWHPSTKFWCESFDNIHKIPRTWIRQRKVLMKGK